VRRAAAAAAAAAVTEPPVSPGLAVRAAPRVAARALPAVATPVARSAATAESSALPGLLDALLAAATAPAAGGVPATDVVGPALSERLSLVLDALPIAPAQRRTVESATGLIGRALSEPDADTAIRRLLRRLEAPLLRLALRDPAFLASRIHSGRRLVDLIPGHDARRDPQRRVAWHDRARAPRSCGWQAPWRVGAVSRRPTRAVRWTPRSSRS
jgi:hypothetical protein